MSGRNLAMLLSLGAIWGASYYFNEIALRDLEPSVLIAARLALGALALLPAAFLFGAAQSFGGLRRHARAIALVAVLNAAVPFFLIAWGQQYIDSGLTGILVAASPLLTALLAALFVGVERPTGLRLAGIVLGFAGVAVLLGVQPDGGRDALLGSVAILLAALCYSVSGLFIGTRLSAAPRLSIALGTTAGAAVLMTPFALVQWPDERPGAGPLLAVLALGVLGTGLAYLIYLGLIAGAGASRAILVNYLIPAMAVIYGATLLDEPVTASIVIGLGLVLGGTAVATGVLARRR